MLEEITSESLLAHVDVLVACGTRKWDQPGSVEAQSYIENLFGEFQLDEVQVHDFDSGSDNIIGILRGSKHPERVHVIGAHYDSIGNEGPTDPAPGADDNASGTAAVIEAARVIGKSGYRPEDTILFVAFTSEERGRVGSKRYVSKLLKEDVAVVDMISLDVIGYVHPGTEPDLSVSSSTFTPEINAMIALMGEVAAAYLPDWPFEGGPGCG
jgi:Zn-dependent M28 family amino/carboxypeptidase